MTTTLLTPNQITLRAAIVAHYLETGHDCTVKEIAAKLAWSESKVRNALNNEHGFCLPGLRPDDETRTSYSTHYKMFSQGGPQGHGLRPDPRLSVGAAKRDAERAGARLERVPMRPGRFDSFVHDRLTII